MERQNNFFERLRYQPPLPGQPLAELVGDWRVLIENHAGVTEYSPQRVCVRVRYGTLCICGNDLELVCMTSQQLAVVGQIDGIQIRREGRP